MVHKKIMGKKKILLLGTNPFALNRGCTAMCRSSIEIIKKYIPDALLTIGGYSLEYGDLNASLYAQKYGNDQSTEINVLESGMLDKIKKIKKIIVVLNNMIKLNFAVDLCLLWRFFKYFGIETSKIFCKNKIFKQFYHSDIIVDLKWGDQFTDIYSMYHTCAWINESIIPILLNKPYILLPQTIGPFKNRAIYFLAKFILDRTKIIIVRERKSEEYIFKMGVYRKKIFLIPDTAFYLDPIASEDADIILNKESVSVDPNSTILGITLRYVGTAGQDKSTYENYIKIIVQIAEYMQKKYGCNILLIPHDGVETSKRVYEEFLNKIGNKKKIFYLKNRDYSTEELRGIIGRCDILLSSLMHANVAALSMHVPTINFAYSYKAIGVFGVLGQEKYVLNLKDLTYEKTISTIEEAWSNREKIRKELETKMPGVKKRLMFAGELVKKVLDEQESR
ncbi:hypothetical protein CVT91_08150, partial [Candidatus Atribacteria bacterium HGW-Atribacteria-1]